MCRTFHSSPCVVGTGLGRCSFPVMDSWCRRWCRLAGWSFYGDDVMSGRTYRSVTTDSCLSRFTIILESAAVFIQCSSKTYWNLKIGRNFGDCKLSWSHERIGHSLSRTPYSPYICPSGLWVHLVHLVHCSPMDVVVPTQTDSQPPFLLFSSPPLRSFVECLDSKWENKGGRRAMTDGTTATTANGGVESSADGDTITHNDGRRSRESECPRRHGLLLRQKLILCNEGLPAFR